MRFLKLMQTSVRFNQTVATATAAATGDKATILQKWLRYWKVLVQDYKQVSLDVLKSAKENPRLAVLAAGGAYAVSKVAAQNPNEEKFMQLLRYWNNQLIMVSPALQNPTSSEHLRLLEQAINQNRLRFMSLGLFTLLWLDRYDKDDCTYPAICKYTRLHLWHVPWHIVDVGFMGKYWNLQWKMYNFDVNYL